MAITFNKKSWKSRISEHPTRRRLTIVDQSLSYSLVDVAREEGTVEQVGDTFDKSTMDDLENRIENIAITAQAECDGLQEQIDEMPSLDDTKAIDIGWKESGTRNTASDTIRVNPFEVYSGTVEKKTGKNLFNKDDSSLVGEYFITNEGQLSGQTYFTQSVILPIKSNTTYTVSKTAGNRFGLATFTSYPTSTMQSTIYVFDQRASSITITSGNSDTYLVAYVFNSQVDTGTVEDMLASVQIEKGSTATTYEPYTESKVITGFIPSAKFFQMGRAFCQETPVKNWSEELNSYYKGMRLNVTNDAFITEEPVDTSRVNEIRTMYAYDYDNEQFLASVAGEIYTSTGSISCDLRVTDIWGCGANGQHQYHSDTTVPVDLPNRLLTNANGFPIELTPVNQSDVSSLVVGSPVSFRITGELYILLWMGGTLTEYVNGMHLSKFYQYDDSWTDTRDGVHYNTHYIYIEKGTTFNLSDETTLINYHFLQCSIRGNQSSDPRDYLEWTVTDSNVAITATASATGYGTGLILEVDHRKNGDETGDYDTHETIIVNVVAGS